MSEQAEAASEKTGVLEGFKAFLMRGNVIDLAVAVVVGTAFTSVVDSMVKGVINPLVGAFGTKDLDQYSSCLKAPCETNDAGEVVDGIPIMWGTVLSAALTFLITSAVVYFLMVLPMSRYLARRAAKRAQEEDAQAEAVTEEIALLREIRDALVTERSGLIAGAGNQDMAIGGATTGSPDTGSAGEPTPEGADTSVAEGPRPAPRPDTIPEQGSSGVPSRDSGTIPGQDTGDRDT